MSFQSTKIIELGSCAFRQPNANSHCKYLHGYRLTAKFWFEAKHLDQNNWVVDFGGLKDLKNILRDQFDHTTCISRSDPYVNEFKKLRDAGVCDLRLMDGVGIEMFSEWCFKAANKFVAGITNNRCQCIKAEVFEHESNSAVYVPGDGTLIYNSDESIEQESQDQCEIDFSGDLKVDIEKPISVEKDQPKDLTQPPFKKTSSKKSADLLWPKKTENKWLNPDSTWGI